jgi:acetyl/propionyl-CoA carboxylase alpha subunit/acetyl-CoA carboxylase carboxyltransferase component
MFKKLLVANRGEIALRLIRAAHELGTSTVAVFAADDAGAPHTQLARAAVALDGTGPAAYLDIAALVAIARQHGCDALHPGYGFLSERAAAAEACAAAGIHFIGPTPAQLALFGDKARARALAADLGVPLLPGTAALDLDAAQAFLAEQRQADPEAGIVLKAVAGGGGRGMRVVSDAAQLPEAWQRCRAEAEAAFGLGTLYAERLLPRARHVEVQLLGDGQDVIVLGDRDCTLQRRFQKLVEIAPAPALPPALRTALHEAALRLARATGYRSLGTVEFLVDTRGAGALPFAFIEANPRLQVEHTVTEAVTGLDLVQAQIAVAAGATLGRLGLDPRQAPAARGVAIQWRINAEALDAQGRVRPTQGRISAVEWPQGPGIRIDGHARAGLVPSPHYDSLLAKLVVHHPGRALADALRRSHQALAECRIDGLATNLDLLRRLAAEPALAMLGEDGSLHTRWLDDWMAGVAAQFERHAEGRARSADDTCSDHSDHSAHDTHGADRAASDDNAGPRTLRAPMPGRIVQLDAAPGDARAAGRDVLVLEAMKMQHGLALPAAGRIDEWLVAAGELVEEHQPLLRWTPAGPFEGSAGSVATAEADAPVRPDLQRLLARRALTLDSARPEAMARRHATGGRSARENIADLCDEGSFSEYGAFAIAAQTRRRPVEELERQTPADGLVSGIGTVNAAHFGAQAARCAVMAYDYTVLAGTQGLRNHAKKDRLLGLAHDLQLPMVLFAEGGGGRPGDVDMPIVAGLNNHTFSQYAALSGRVPVLGIAHGRCFAGNAALLGCSDTIIATRAANIGMGGPAMIEGGGLGQFRPEQIGPAAELHAAGAVDLLVDDEAAAVAAARLYLVYLQGALDAAAATHADPLALRQAVPENRLRAYDMHALLRTLCDIGSVLELRTGFGRGMVTALARIGGRPLGLIANDPRHLGGAIDADGAAKAARFLQLCEAHGLPLLSVCDTPGFMVGPEIERRGHVRHACRMFLAAARLSVPCFTVVVRKGYGLGAQAMAFGGFDAPVFTIAWPSAEFGAMGLEGAVRLGFRKELEAAAEGPDRQALFDRLVAQQYANGSALNMAATLEIDAVIDPAETRDRLLRGLASAAAKPREAGRRFIDGW